MEIVVVMGGMVEKGMVWDGEAKTRLGLRGTIGWIRRRTE